MSVTVHTPVELKHNAERLRTFIAGLAAVGPPAGPLNGAKVRLFKNDISPGPDTVLANLVTADYGGYADSPAVVWSAGDTDFDDRAVLVGASQNFAPTDSVTPNTIYGYCIMDSTSTNLLFAERFPNSVDLTSPADILVIVPMFRAGVS